MCVSFLSNMIETWIKHAFPGFWTQGMQCRTQFGDKTWKKIQDGCHCVWWVGWGWGLNCLSNILFINSLLMIGTLINHGSYSLQTQIIHFNTQFGGEIQYGCHRRRKMYIDIHTIIWTCFQTQVIHYNIQIAGDVATFIYLPYLIYLYM